MALSALRTKPPLRLASLHVRAHLDENCESELLPGPAQLNVLADEFASEVLEDLRVADKPAEFYGLPAFRVYLRDGTRRITNRTNSPSTKSVRTLKSATIGPTTSMIQSIGLPIEQQFLHSTSATLGQLGVTTQLTKHLKDTPTAADLRCTIVKGIQQ
jgi:hypothetical protein